MPRTQDELTQNPCVFKLKEYLKDGPNIERVKKLVPKLDENGNQVYKVVPLTQATGSGCGCKKNQANPVSESSVGSTARVPDMVETWEEKPLSEQDKKMVLCKLYGPVKASHCEKCTTYKKQ